MTSVRSENMQEIIDALVAVYRRSTLIKNLKSFYRLPLRATVPPTPKRRLIKSANSAFSVEYQSGYSTDLGMVAEDATLLWEMFNTYGRPTISKAIEEASRRTTGAPSAPIPEDAYVWASIKFLIRTGKFKGVQPAAKELEIFLREAIAFVDGKGPAMRNRSLKLMANVAFLTKISAEFKRSASAAKRSDVLRSKYKRIEALRKVDPDAKRISDGILRVLLFLTTL
jgi:hypothetical protein